MYSAFYFKIRCSYCEPPPFVPEVLEPLDWPLVFVRTFPSLNFVLVFLPLADSVLIFISSPLSAPDTVLPLVPDVLSTLLPEVVLSVPLVVPVVVLASVEPVVPVVPVPVLPLVAELELSVPLLLVVLLNPELLDDELFIVLSCHWPLLLPDRMVLVSVLLMLLLLPGRVVSEPIRLLELEEDPTPVVSVVVLVLVLVFCAFVIAVKPTNTAANKKVFFIMMKSLINNHFAPTETKPLPTLNFCEIILQRNLRPARHSCTSQQYKACFS
jgi:hypothetical protein